MSLEKLRGEVVRAKYLLHMEYTDMAAETGLTSIAIRQFICRDRNSALTAEALEEWLKKHRTELEKI